MNKRMNIDKRIKSIDALQIYDGNTILLNENTDTSTETIPIQIYDSNTMILF